MFFIYTNFCHIIFFRNLVGAYLRDAPFAKGEENLSVLSSGDVLLEGCRSEIGTYYGLQPCLRGCISAICTYYGLCIPFYFFTLLPFFMKEKSLTQHAAPGIVLCF